MFISINHKVFLFGLIISIFATSPVLAECNPGEPDACAPKKVLGAWEKSVNFGFNLTQGNSETTLFTIGGAANKEQGENIYTFNLAYNFGKDKNIVKEDGSDTTRNDLRSNFRYDRLLTDQLFIGMGISHLYDEIADIDYRVILDPGLGYYFLKDNTFKLRIDAGPAYVFEKQGGISNDYLAPKIGDKFEWALTCTSKIFQKAELLLDASNSDNYIVNAELGAEAALDASLSLVVTIRELYDNEPAPDKEKGDLAVISALKVNL